MCNAYEQHVRWVEYCQMMQALELEIPTQQTELDLPQADDIRINDMGPVMRTAGNMIELAQMNFSFPPSGPRGGPVFNFRSEGRDFADSKRCLIPASGFYEFTGKKYPKTKHRFSLIGATFMAIAGLWREAQPKNWAAWLHLTKPQGELLRPLPEGSLVAETVRQGVD
jgi:putative SOS response-associated peptidase YedK